MVDLANVFYVLGIIFFLTCLTFVILGIAFIVNLNSRISKLRSELPMKVVSYLKDNNKIQMKAFGIALVGFILSLLRGRVQAGKKTTK
jgi:hypothetical protein